jgi:hypothetical protein
MRELLEFMRFNKIRTYAFELNLLLPLAPTLALYMGEEKYKCVKFCSKAKVLGMTKLRVLRQETKVD